MAQGVTLYRWSAKRSGPAMTVTGEDADGTMVKIQAKLIEVKRGRVVAHSFTNDGRAFTHDLLP